MKEYPLLVFILGIISAHIIMTLIDFGENHLARAVEIVFILVFLGFFSNGKTMRWWI